MRRRTVGRLLSFSGLSNRFSTELLGQCVGMRGDNVEQYAIVSRENIPQSILSFLGAYTLAHTGRVGRRVETGEF